jgi:hypothetical protein
MEERKGSGKAAAFTGLRHVQEGITPIPTAKIEHITFTYPSCLRYYLTCVTTAVSAKLIWSTVKWQAVDKP